MYDHIHSVASEQFQRVKDHYKPYGCIFLIVEDGWMSEAVLAAYAHFEFIPVIQLGSHGLIKMREIEDPIKRAKEFARRIKHEITPYKQYVKHVKMPSPKKIEANTMFCFESL